MNRMDHPDRHLVEAPTRAARETVRDEPRGQSRRQRRRAALHAASGAVALYAGAAVTLAAGLGLAVVLPDWAAALVTAGLLGALAHGLRKAAKPVGSRDGAGTADGRPDGRSTATAPGFGATADGPPPVPPTTAGVLYRRTVAHGAPPVPRRGDCPVRPHHRA